MNIATFIKNSIVAIFKGEFILRLGIGKYFFHIVYVFLLLSLTIWLSLMMDSSMNKVENNKAEIHKLETIYTMRKYELEQCNDRRIVRERLEALGSTLAEPSVPANRLED